MSEFSRASLNEDDEDLPSCTVCLHSYDNGWHRPYDIGCGHCLCQRCYVKWTGRKLCPACRKEWHNPHVSFDFLGAIDIIKAKQRELRQAVPGHTSTSHIHDNHACEEQSSVSLIVKLRERQRALRAAESATWAGRMRHKLGLSGLAEAEMSLREVVHHAALSYNVPSWAVTLAKTLGPGALLLLLALAWRYVYAVALLVIPMVVAAAAYVDHEDVADAEHVDSNQVVQVVVPHEQQRVRSESFTEESDEESEDVEGQQVGRGTQGREENPEREVVMDGARAGNRIEHTPTLSSTETDVDLQLRDAGIAQGGVQNANESGSHQHLVLARDFDEDYDFNEFEDEDDADLLELRFQAAAELGLYEDDLDVEYVEGAEHNSFDLDVEYVEGAEHNNHDLDVEDVEGAEHNNHDSKLLPMFPEHASQHVDASDSDALSRAALVREQKSTLPDGLMREQATSAEGTLCDDMDARTRADGGTAGVNDSGDEQQAGSERKRSSVEGGTMLREDVQGVGVDHHEEDRRAWGCGSDLDDGKRIGLVVKKSHGEEEDSEPRGFDQLGMLQSALHLHAKRAQQFQHVMRLHEASLEGFQTLRARLNGLAAEVEGSVNLSEGLLSVSAELAGSSSASLERFASSYLQCQGVNRVEASGTLDYLSGLPITHPALLQTLQNLADSEDKELLHLVQNFRRSYESAPHTSSKLPTTQPPPEGSGSAMHGRDMSQTPYLNPWGKAHEQMELTVAVSSKSVEASGGVHLADVPAVATERDVATASTSLLTSEAGGFVFKDIANCQSAAAATVPSASSVELVASSASSFTTSAVDNRSYWSRDPHKITSLMGEAEAQNKTHSSSLQNEVSTTNHQNVSIAAPSTSTLLPAFTATAAPSTSTLLPAFTASLPAGPVTLTSTVDPPQPRPSPASPILASPYFPILVSQQPLTQGNHILSAGVSAMLSHATSPISRVSSSPDLTAEVVSSEALAARQDGDDSNAAPDLRDSTRVSITESSLQQQSLAEHSERSLPLPTAPLPAQPSQQTSGGNQTGRMFTLALLLTCIPSMLTAFFTLWHHMVLQRVLMWLMLGGLLLRISEGIWQQLVGRPAALHHPSAAAALQSRGSSWFTLLPTSSTHRSGTSQVLYSFFRWTLYLSVLLYLSAGIYYTGNPRATRVLTTLVMKVLGMWVEDRGAGPSSDDGVGGVLLSPWVAAWTMLRVCGPPVSFYVLQASLKRSSQRQLSHSFLLRTAIIVGLGPFLGLRYTLLLFQIAQAAIAIYVFDYKMSEGFLSSLRQQPLLLDPAGNMIEALGKVLNAWTQTSILLWTLLVPPMSVLLRIPPLSLLSGWAHMGLFVWPLLAIVHVVGAADTKALLALSKRWQALRVLRRSHAKQTVAVEMSVLLCKAAVLLLPLLGWLLSWIHPAAPTFNWTVLSYCLYLLDVVLLYRPRLVLNVMTSCESSAACVLLAPQAMQMHLEANLEELGLDDEDEESDEQEGSREISTSTPLVRTEMERRVWRIPRDEGASEEVLTTLGTTVSRRHLPPFIEASPWRRITRPRHLPPSASGDAVNTANGVPGRSGIASAAEAANPADSHASTRLLPQRQHSSDQQEGILVLNGGFAQTSGRTSQSGVQAVDEGVFNQVPSTPLLDQQSSPDSLTEAGQAVPLSEATFHMGSWEPLSSAAGDGDVALRRRLLMRGRRWR